MSYIHRKNHILDFFNLKKEKEKIVYLIIVAVQFLQKWWVWYSKKYTIFYLIYFYFLEWVLDLNFSTQSLSLSLCLTFFLHLTYNKKKYDENAFKFLN
jgi:hypothetical protein